MLNTVELLKFYSLINNITKQFLEQVWLDILKEYGTHQTMTLYAIKRCYSHTLLLILLNFIISITFRKELVSCIISCRVSKKKVCRIMYHQIHVSGWTIPSILPRCLSRSTYKVLPQFGNYFDINHVGIGVSTIVSV